MWSSSTPMSSGSESPSGTLPPSSLPSSSPRLEHSFEASTSDPVNSAYLLSTTDGLITVGEDRSLRLWLQRESGLYWPSICHYLPSAITCLCYDELERRVFVGTDSGTINEFVVSDDFNKLESVKEYHAHLARINDILFDTHHKWILSVSKDRYFQFHCTLSGKRLGGYQFQSQCTALALDSSAQYAFVGDYSGVISVLRLSATETVVFVNILKGHSGSIQRLHWQGDLGLLFSCSYDNRVLTWDIGGRSGTVYELYGHTDKVTAAVYIEGKRASRNQQQVLLTTSSDGHLVAWDMSVRREETVEWQESDLCQLCRRPFFWNLRAMYEQKQIGLRQHHCRKCGKAVCANCSSRRSALPLKGHELSVRLCEECFIKLHDYEKESHARFYDLGHSVRWLHVDIGKKRMLTVGEDRMIKIWDIRDVID